MEKLATSLPSPVETAAPPARRRTSIWTWIGVALVMVVVVTEAVGGNSVAVRTLTVTFISIVLEAIPFIMIGALVGGVIEVFVSREWVARILPRRPLLACMAAGCLGLALPVCECAVVPVTRRLVRKGVPFSAAMTYLLAGPIFNPLVAASTIVAYGWDWRVLGVRMICGYGVGVLVGYVMGRIYKGHTALIHSWAEGEIHAEHDHTHGECGHDHEHGGNGCGHDHGHQARARRAPSATIAADVLPLGSSAPGGNLLRQGVRAKEEHCGCGHEHATTVSARLSSVSLGRKFLAVLDHAGEDFLYVGQFLIVGAFVAAIAQTFIARQVFVTLAHTPVASILMMMLLAVFLNLCSEADAFVASSFRSVLPLSSQMAFMVLGPMLDFKLTAMYLGFLRKRAFVTMVIIMGALVLSAMLLFHASTWEVTP